MGWVRLQDRMHMLEADLISLKLGRPMETIRQLERLHPRCLRTPPEGQSTFSPVPSHRR